MKVSLVFLPAFFCAGVMSTPYVPLHKILPPTPALPPGGTEHIANVNNISLWYAVYGPPLNPPTPPKQPPRQQRQVTVLLHGGKSTSNWVGGQAAHLAQKKHTVIVVDTRGHGRSTDDPSEDLSYDLFAKDIVALLDKLGVSQANVAGWSDGANTAISLAMHHGERIDRIFAFGANYRPDQANSTGIAGIPFLADLAQRQRSEWEALNPAGKVPGAYDAFAQRVDAMQSKYPLWGQEDFADIKTRFQDPELAPIVWFVTGDSEEIVQRPVPLEMQDMVPGSALVKLPEVGHFAPVQDPGFFNTVVDAWLARKR